ncbi:MAG: hypothetical protein HYY26_04425 [Acidobacteria bacterium]|nr:hypothetical protein [Acidobacteriota bacterium]
MDDSSQETNQQGKQNTRVYVLIAVLALFALGLGYSVYAHHQLRQQSAAQTEALRTQVAQLESQVGVLDDRYADLRGELTVTAEKLGLTEQQLSRARAVAQQLKEEQRRTAAQLNAQLAEHETELSTLGTEVSGVRGELQSAVGDLGIQSGLIATTREELEELKRRGDRAYLEFNVPKSKNYTRVGDFALRLRKTDTKRQKYTVYVLVNDKLIEKKDKTIYEPVQFYPEGRAGLVELVVFEVSKDRVAGYISVPKEMALSQPQP